MKPTSLFLCLLFLVSCKNDDDNGIDCSLIDFESPNFFIELVDANGNNLIENETYKGDDITITFNSTNIEGVVFKDVPSIENLITMNLFGNEGNNIFEINLSDNETDILNLNLSKNEGVCGIPVYTINEVTYNDTIQTLKDFDGNYLITVVK